MITTIEGSTEMWTAERVKEELPNVSVLVESHNLARGWVHGRSLDFAEVFLPSDGRHFQFAWDTIAKSLNSGKPLRI